MAFPKHVRIVEVGPRDGLQNETTVVPTNTKIAFIDRLSDTGLATIEATSFVAKDKIPQLADNTAVMTGISRKADVSYPVLVPNLQGLEDALASEITEIGVFTAVSETFCQHNINCSIDESLNRFHQVIALASQHNINVRGYISCCLGCPYEGKMDITKVAELANALFDMGCYEISLGDTIGVGTPNQARELINVVSDKVPLDKLAAHFHNTYGQALANLYAVLELGIQTVDSSVAGLGGCPYAKGASGNVATEDVIYMLNGLGIETGINLDKLIDAGRFICDALQISPHSNVALAQK
ncbi:MAG: hydroxymethylglutaryl-CoA lyase [Legionellales bacterium]|nr:hydroxymethylglutaryl-CoA lyase [Legionellales bacterium]|tara:strand:+ start:12185 stop:13078 length:894 start_codon:yes stop_codon:yes gene_type:complete